MYADFESALVPLTEKDEDLSVGIEPKAKRKKKGVQQKAYQRHDPVSYFTKLVSIDPEFKLEEEHDFEFPQDDPYVGKDAATHFLDYTLKVAQKTYARLFDNPVPMKLSEEEKRKYEAATECHICIKRYEALERVEHKHEPGENPKHCYDCQINAKLDSMKFTQPIPHVHAEKEDEKNCPSCANNARCRVRDHCHVLGDFRGAAHQDCNLQYNIKKSTWKLPVLFHNLRGYDGHMLIRALKPRHGKVRVIPSNLDKYLALQVGKVIFLDSFQFAQQGWDSLVSTLRDENLMMAWYGMGD